MKLLQDILFLDQHILISLPNSSACAAGLPFFPLPEAKRGLEPLLTSLHPANVEPQP